MEILKERVNKEYFYSAVYHSDPYSVQESIDVGYIDEVISEDRFMERVIKSKRASFITPSILCKNQTNCSKRKKKEDWRRYKKA